MVPGLPCLVACHLPLCNSLAHSHPILVTSACFQVVDPRQLAPFYPHGAAAAPEGLPTSAARCWRSCSWAGGTVGAAALAAGLAALL